MDVHSGRHCHSERHCGWNSGARRRLPHPHDKNCREGLRTLSAGSRYEARHVRCCQYDI